MRALLSIATHYNGDTFEIGLCSVPNAVSPVFVCIHLSLPFSFQ